MSSYNVLRRVGDYLIYHFTVDRKETSFDLSSSIHPLRHYPIHHEKSVITYTTDFNLPLKHHFSTYEIRKRITKFLENETNDDRLHKLTKLLQSYIKQKTRMCFNETLFKIKKQPSWNSTWWRTVYSQKSSTFQITRLMSQYNNPERRKKPQAIYNRYSPTVRRGNDHSRYSTKSEGWPRIRGYSPVLRTVPHPYASRGEAERVVKQAAKLLLISEKPILKKSASLKSQRLSIDRKHQPERSSIAGEDKSPIKKTVVIADVPNDIELLESKSSDITGNTSRTTAFKIRKLSQKQDDNETLSNTDHSSFDNDRVESDSTKDKVNKYVLDNATNITNTTHTETAPTAQTNEKDDNNLLDVHPPSSSKPPSVPLNMKKGFCRKTTTDSSVVKQTPEIVETEFQEESPFIFSQEMDGSLRDSDPNKALFGKDYGTESFLSHQLSDISNNAINDDNNNVAKTSFSKNKNNNNSKKANVKQTFLIRTTTGDRIGASSNAPVWLFIEGEKDRLPRSVHLKRSRTHCQPFCRGNTDEFLLKSSTDIGFIKSIQIGHNSEQPGSDWFLESVVIEDLDMHYHYEFPCHRWLSVRSKDGRTQVHLEYKALIHKVLHESSKSDASVQCSDERNQDDFNCQEQHNHSFVVANDRRVCIAPFSNDKETAALKQATEIVQASQLDESNTETDMSVEMSHITVTETCHSCFSNYENVNVNDSNNKNNNKNKEKQIEFGNKLIYSNEFKTTDDKQRNTNGEIIEDNVSQVTVDTGESSSGSIRPIKTGTANRMKYDVQTRALTQCVSLPDSMCSQSINASSKIHSCTSSTSET